MKKTFSSLLSNSAILFFLNIFASALNYICQIIMARELCVDDFGTISVVFSFLLISSVPGSTIMMLVAKHYATENAKRDGALAFFCEVVKKVFFVTLFLLILFLILFEPIRILLKIQSVEIVVLMIILSAFSLFQPLFSGVISGYKSFIILGVYSLLIPFYKLFGIFFSCFFTNSSDRTVTILFTMVIGTILTAFIGYLLSKKLIGSTYKQTNIAKIRFKKNIIDVLITNILLMIYMNIDLIFIRISSSSIESGYYSSAVLFGRIIYYLSTSIATIVLPMSAEGREKKASIKILNKALLILLVFSIICLIPVNIFGDEITCFVFGIDYLGASKYLIYISFISVALSIITILSNYLIGKGKEVIVNISMTLGLFIILLCSNRMAIFDLLTVIAVVGFVIFVSCYLLFVLGDRRSEREQNN